MKVKQIAILLLMIPALFSCDPPSEITLTIGDKKDLAAMIPPKFSSESLTWASSDSEVASVSDNGIVTAVGFKGGGGRIFNMEPASGSAVITVTSGKLSYSITVNTVLKGTVDIMNLPPMKDSYKDYFMIGNIFNPRDVDSLGIENEWLTHHYNILTAENSMKPSSISSSQDNYNFNSADRMVNAALASGLKVHGHTLIWHSQIPQWQKEMANKDRATALAAMRKFITDVMTHYKGKIYSWDVMNEIFTDGVGSSTADWKTSIRQENPWFAAIGADFVYEGYLAARLADPGAVLYYNDYNTDQSNKARVIANMVREVNNRYKQAYPNETRLLIEGIGMQEHHNTGVRAFSIRNTLELFKPLGVKVSAAELDLLAQSWSEFRGSTGSGIGKDADSTVTNRGLLDQAELYKQYMKLYMEYSDIIERVSVWGVTDDLSWRSGGLPLLFDANNKAKPAYYGFVSALED
uniref:Beta-xylanase n=1 Tax=uncultured bacterium contig00023 TaxID=1181512 RepID=A0A806JZB9_9BACT|nr:endo-1,4-beta-xylanase A precursor [uncultured bacterium contig00023]